MSGGIAVPEVVVGHGTGGIFVLNLGTHFVDVLLELPNRIMGGDTVRDKQLVPPGCDRQEFLKFDADTFVDGYRADLAALPFDGDGILPKGPLSELSPLAWKRTMWSLFRRRC